MPEPRRKFAYHEKQAPDISNGADLTIGFEIEKNEMPDWFFTRDELLADDFVIEEDGSVSNGFELKTPVYDLYSPETDAHLLKIEKYCNVKDVRGAGGHINFGKRGVRPIDLVKKTKGFIPLIYALWKDRAHNQYCQLVSINRIGVRRQSSINIKEYCAEYRIVGPVRNFADIKFRLELFRIIGNNLGATFDQVLEWVGDPTHDLFVLLKDYDSMTEQKLDQLAKDMMYFENITQGCCPKQNISTAHQNFIDKSSYRKLVMGDKETGVKAPRKAKVEAPIPVSVRAVPRIEVEDFHT